jgi:uncharacterized protein (TIGR02145 family)
MKQIRLLGSAALFMAMTMSGCAGSSGKEASSSDHEGRPSTQEPTASFSQVKIGEQVWMAENLDVDKFRNGDPIPHIKTSEEWEKAGEEGKPAWCDFDNDPANGEKYGKLYNWHAVNDPRGLAPEGWQIPSDEDWTQLENFLGEKAGNKMKSTGDWTNDGQGTNESGFNGLPGGTRDYYGVFADLGRYGFWWSSTKSPDGDAWYRDLSFLSDDVGRGYFSRGGFSVRCLRENQAAGDVAQASGFKGLE